MWTIEFFARDKVIIFNKNSIIPGCSINIHWTKPAGGWDAKTDNYDFSNFIMDNLDDEIDQAFKNCDYNLKNAGGKGWSQVYKIVTYSTDIYSQHERIVHNLKKWMPEHTPIWTELGVNHLGLKEMNIEIDVEAYDEEGAAEARKAKA